MCHTKSHEELKQLRILFFSVLKESRGRQPMLDEVAKPGHRGQRLLQTFFLDIHGSKTAPPSLSFKSGLQARRAIKKGKSRANWISFL